MPKMPLCIAILWHMHQPDYGNEQTGEIYLPWTRFHAIKDYYDMGALVEEVPEMRVTFNLVPSLIDQLCSYAGGSAKETYAALTLRDASMLDRREKSFLLRGFFQLPWKQMILPYARYRELLGRRGMVDEKGEFSAGLRRYSTQDYRDLQVWFNLSWCGNELRKDPYIAGLLKKGRGFNEEEKEELLRHQSLFVGRILPLYRTLLESGRSELSVSPYYHPILPLLCDSRSAREVLPDIPLPANVFAFSEDAREQIRRAKERFRTVFGREVAGMWPSEGSISDAAASLVVDAGLAWLASDEGVLQQSLKKSGSGSSLRLAQKYSVHRWGNAGKEIDLFFRDHELSDLIGFTYSRWSAEEGVSDFLERLHRIHQELPDDGRHFIVPVILDGENAWEHYSNNGIDFLRLFYRRLADSTYLRPVTFSEFLALERHRETLTTIAAGSWIHSSLSTWIGHHEKNSAWEALTEARHALARSAGPETPERRKAFEEILIAEGSDWFWWYGDDHQTENAAEFDALFRTHLKNVYRHLEALSPSALDLPIKKSDIRTLFRNPVHTISPRLDGAVTDYFEWLSAGFAVPSGGGAMHKNIRYLEKVYFGYDKSRFYVRIDFLGSARGKIPPRTEIRLRFLSPKEFLLVLQSTQNGEWLLASRPPLAGAAPEFAVGKIVEVGITLQALGIAGPEEVRFDITILEGARELERFPSTGYLAVPVDPWNLDLEEWVV